MEQAMYGSLSGRIPVPALLYCNRAEGGVPYRFAIQKYIEGKSLNEYLLEKRRYPLELVGQNGAMLASIESSYVLSHGDFSYSNMIVNPAGKVFFTDLEYVLAANR